MSRFSLILPALVLGLVACAGAAPPSKGAGMKDAAPSAIEGTATYRERIAMPPGAEFEAVLQDVTRADAPAMEIARAPARTSRRRRPADVSLRGRAAQVVSVRTRRSNVVL